MAEAARSSDGKAEPNHSAVIVHDRDGSSPQPRASSSGSASSPEVDPESALSVNPDPKAAGDCRICYLALDNAASESGPPIVLGCSCKHDLAAAHQRCAQTWFQAKGNRICEICGSTANNVVVSADAASTEQMNEGDDDPAMAPAQPSSSSSDRSLWRRQCFLNLLLTFLVFLCAFSWLYHYNLPY
ncbi:RINGv [Musa troglodytarum]|uniref:RINGv n=1 Tax=Musa troglodytarum TaxID=320322 RepID=A0A9E7K5Q0_9LILI|nr:RINGv [Musa troglodytarum]